MTSPHILLTGSSRGIGAAIATALGDARVIGHGTHSGIPAVVIPVSSLSSVIG